jgi:hypothetical protein
MIRHTGGNSNIKTLQDKWELQNNNPIELFCDNKAAITFSGKKMIYSFNTRKIPEFVDGNICIVKQGNMNL